MNLPAWSVALAFSLVSAEAVFAQVASERVSVQVIQNQQAGRTFVSTTVGDPIVDDASTLGLKMKAVTARQGDTLDLILIRHGIQPDAFSRRYVLELNPSLRSAHEIPVGTSVNVLSGDDFFDQRDMRRDLGTKLRLKPGDAISIVALNKKIAASQSAADELLKLGADAPLTASLNQLKWASERLSKTGADTILLSPNEVATIDLANRVLDPANPGEIYVRHLDLLRKEAATIATNTYTLGYTRSFTPDKVYFDVRIRTCSTKSCGRSWSIGRDKCESNQDKCGLKVCYRVSGEYLEQRYQWSKSESPGQFTPQCTPFPDHSSPAEGRLPDADYQVWAVSLPTQTRVSCFEELFVATALADTAKTITKEINAEVAANAMGTSTCP